MKITLLALISFLGLISQAQNIYFDNTVPPDEMIMDFFDSQSLSVYNVQFSNNPFGIAFFDSGDTPLEVNAGLVFSTGIFYDLGYNAQYFASTALNSGEGDEDIYIATDGYSNYDNTFVEFDLVSTEDRIFDFNYVFGSEEYPEYVGSDFNDAFLFLVTGPGVTGVYTNSAKNIAMIPNSEEAVTINNLNFNIHSEFYLDNQNGSYLSLDGHTTLLPATFEVVANETYHIKIIISDVSDAIFDSAIFLGYNSLGNPDSLVPPTDFSLLKNGNSIEFINESKYATGYQWDFGNGVTSTDRYPEPVIYDTPGTYTVSLTTSNYCCTNNYTTEITVALENLNVDAQVVQNVSCFAGNDGVISLSASGGNGPYEYNSIPEIIDFNAVSAGDYIIQVIDQDGQVAEQVVSVTEPSEIIVSESVIHSDVDMENGAIYNVVTGGTEPYSYLWSNGETTEDIQDLPAGVYSLTITDSNDCQEVREYTVNTIYMALQSNINVIQNVSCFNGNDGQVNLTVTGGNSPYQYEFTPSEISLSQLKAGQYSYKVIDQDGQEVVGEFEITEPSELDISTTVIASTDNNDNGVASVFVNGGVEPYTYLWSNGETTSEINNLSPGEYTVTVTDGNDCEKITFVTVEMVVHVIGVDLGKLNIYPNPAKDYVYIDGFNASVNTVSIYDVHGKEYNALYKQEENTLSINIADIIPGMFTVNIISENGKRYTGNFVKMK